MQVRMAPAAVTGSSPRARSPGSTPGGGDGPHVGAVPGVRLDIDAGPHGPGRGHRVEPLRAMPVVAVRPRS